MIGKSIILSVAIGVTATAAVVLGVGYFGLGKPRGSEHPSAPVVVPAPAPEPKASTITISGQFKKDLGKHPVFVLGDRPVPFEGDEESQKSFLANGRVEIVSLDGKVVASGDIAENGTFAVEIPPAPKYIVRANNDVVSVSYAVITGGLPDMKPTAASKAEAAKGVGAGHGEHSEAAAH